MFELLQIFNYIIAYVLLMPNFVLEGP